MTTQRLQRGGRGDPTPQVPLPHAEAPRRRRHTAVLRGEGLAHERLPQGGVHDPQRPQSGDRSSAARLRWHVSCIAHSVPTPPQYLVLARHRGAVYYAMRAPTGLWELSSREEAWTTQDLSEARQVAATVHGVVCRAP